MIDLIAYITVRALNKIFALVPISMALWIGRRMGGIAFFFNKKRRLAAYSNLRAAFCREKYPRELKAITKRVYQNMAQTFMEVLNLTKINRKYVDKYVKVINMERIRNASKSGRGAILLTGHFGNWELSSLVSSVEGFPILVLAREQKMKRLNELLNRLRESNGCKVIRKGMSTKNILKALYGKNIVGILSDQDAGKKGMFVDFFGRPTSSHSGPFEIAKHTGSIILPNFIVRLKGPYHKLFLEEYIDFRQTKSEDDVKYNLQRFTMLLESYVRKYPDQWLWPHKRWKSTPTRTVLVLNDGRAGHLNQSLAIAKQIQKARTTQGFNADDTKIVVVDVKFKSKLSKGLLSIHAAFSTWRCHGCMACMKRALAFTSYANLMHTYADFIVSCGSSLAGANIFIARENNAKNVIVMKPDIFGSLRKFNLAVIPEHDRPPKTKNVVTTKMAPNLIDEELLKAEGEKLKCRLRVSGKDVIGLLMGGDNPEFKLTREISGKVIEGLVKFCRREDAEFLVTTSRRTPHETEILLKDKLKGEPRCRLLVIANEDNPKETVGGILGLSRIAIVSNESISMISEAINALKRVIVFSLKKKDNILTKHERALQGLEKKGYITICDAENLDICLKKVWNERSPVKKLDDREKIFEAVRRLI